MAKVDVVEAFSKHMFSIQSKDDVEEIVNARGLESASRIVKMYRARLKLSQKQMALALGYSSASMCHHFEKGLREATLKDLLTMMSLADDDVRGFIQSITDDAPFADQFSSGRAAKTQGWEVYWSSHYISAVHQMMRTDGYESLARYRLGMFSDILGISIEQEQHALAVLGKLGIARFKNGKPLVDPSVKILLPHNVSPQVLTDFKLGWIDYGTRRFKKKAHPGDLLSVDLIPANPETFAKVVKMIRSLQDEIHNEVYQDTKGFMCLGWMGSYTEMSKG